MSALPKLFWFPHNAKPGAPIILCYPDIVEAGDFLKPLWDSQHQLCLLLKRKWLPSIPWERAAGAVIVDELPDSATLCESFQNLFERAGLDRRPVDEVFVFGEHSIDLFAHIAQQFQKDPWFASVAPLFRDKLRMRQVAEACGIPCPGFVCGNDTEGIERLLGTCRTSTEPHWISKPRNGMGSHGVRTWSNAGDLRQWLTALPEAERETLLIEEFVPGALFHVDGAVHEGRVLASCVSRYGHPLADVVHGGRTFTDLTIEAGTPLEHALQEAHDRVVKGFGLRTGLTHIEFFLASDTGRIVLCEAACRPPGQNLTEFPRILFGQNFLTILGRALRGEPVPPRSNGTAGLIAFVAPQGRLLECTPMEQLEHPDIVARTPTAPAGTLFAHRELFVDFGRVFFHSADESACANAISCVLNQFSFRMEPLS